jgi:hypothetical protein
VKTGRKYGATGSVLDPALAIPKRATTLTGTREAAVESIHAMGAAGIRQVAIQPITDPKETIEKFSKRIIRRT